jgi:hypothetical protein
MKNIEKHRGQIFILDKKGFSVAKRGRGAASVK